MSYLDKEPFSPTKKIVRCGIMIAVLNALINP